MNGQSGPGCGNPRWEYRFVWRYGPLILMAVGLAMLGFGASGLLATAVSVTMLPLGFVCLVAGVVLPRIEGMFTAGPQGISAPLLPVHQIDATYSVTGAAVAAVAAVATAAAVDAAFLPSGVRAVPVLGDVWDVLDRAIDDRVGFRSLGAACGHRHFEMPDGRMFELVNRGFLDWRPASASLLEFLASWGIQPVASGRYPVPSYADPDTAVATVSARVISGNSSTPSK